MPTSAAKGSLVTRHGSYPRSMIKHCLEKGCITYGHIKLVMKSSGILRASTFKAFALNMRKTFPKQAKHLVNHFVGGLGIQFHRTAEGAITNSFETAVGTQLHYDDDSVDFNQIGDAYFMQRRTPERQYTGHKTGGLFMTRLWAS